MTMNAEKNKHSLKNQLFFHQQSPYPHRQIFSHPFAASGEADRDLKCWGLREKHGKWRKKGKRWGKMGRNIRAVRLVGWLVLGSPVVLGGMRELIACLTRKRS